jgi:hypothetical protein
MGPIIVLDKSALQALSSDELLTLHNCYSVNIAPRGKRKTIVEMLTQVEDTQFAVRCEAPSDLYPAYEKLFLALLAGLWVVKG